MVSGFVLLVSCSFILLGWEQHMRNELVDTSRCYTYEWVGGICALPQVLLILAGLGAVVSVCCWFVYAFRLIRLK